VRTPHGTAQPNIKMNLANSLKPVHAGRSVSAGTRSAAWGTWGEPSSSNGSKRGAAKEGREPHTSSTTHVRSGESYGERKGG
jgi:hypothetical protein